MTTAPAPIPLAPIFPANIGGALRRLRERVPLVHGITDLGVANTTANALPAVGAWPAMVEAMAAARAARPVCWTRWRWARSGSARPPRSGCWRWKRR